MNLGTLKVTGPYKSKNGLILGVLAGIAEFYRVSPFFLRVAVVACSFFLFFLPTIILYLVAYFVMPAEPKVRPLTKREKDVYLLGVNNPSALIESLKRRFEEAEHKIRRLEDFVTKKDFRPPQI
ncbi:MAG: PspC domain-containing protein [Deltaproteobacteria bacterium]|jgi:phage shock protein C|nr:PspC domain-containing protein [Deltaproteobacteria bacterium]